MGRTTMTKGRTVARRSAWCRLLAVPALLGLIVAARAPARADDSGAELSAEQRTQLERQAKEWHDLGARRHGQGRLAEATALLEQALQVRQRLYPKEKFPHGTP